MIKHFRGRRNKLKIRYLCLFPTWGKIVLSRQIFTEVYTVAENRVVWLMRTTDYRDLTQTDFRRSEIGFNLFLCMQWQSPQPVSGPRLSQSLFPGCKLSSELFVLRCMTLHFAGLKHMFRAVHSAKCCSLPRRLDPSCFTYHCGISATFPAADLFFFFPFQILDNNNEWPAGRNKSLQDLDESTLLIPFCYNNLLT